MKIIVIKKKWLTYFIILLILFFAFITFFYYRKVISTNSLPTTAKVIVIDPGHGGIDPGAVGKTGVYEKDINLAIGLYLREYLEQSGAIAIMTREEDKSLHTEEGTIRKMKNEDLKNRKQIVIDHQPHAFITIHMNSFPQSKYYGAQVFYPKDNEKSKELADILQKELISVLDKSNKRVALAKEGVYLIKELDVPTALVEGGFLSNLQEEEKLKDPNYQQKIAWALYVGLQKYFKMFYQE